MAENENQDTYLDRPNRRKASSKATKAIVAFLLVVSAVILLIIFLGGMDTLEGAIPLHLIYIVLYLAMAFLVMRWNRGVLPLAAALARGQRACAAAEDRSRRHRRGVLQALA